MKNSKRKEKEKQQNIEKMGDIIKNNRKVGTEYVNVIRKTIFRNIIIAIVFAIYFIFLYLGAKNIESSVYTTDLKVFSICLLITAIVIFEISYKKDNGSLCIHGIEVLILAIVTLFLVYIYSLFVNRFFSMIITFLSILTIIYFIIKSIIILFRMKKQYFKSKNDITEIIKK